MIRYGSISWMMRPVGEATPELEHIRSEAAWSRLSVSRK
jgi:hypothetical protein